MVGLQHDTENATACDSGQHDGTRPRTKFEIDREARAMIATSQEGEQVREEANGITNLILEHWSCLDTV